MGQEGLNRQFAGLQKGGPILQAVELSVAVNPVTITASPVDGILFWSERLRKVFQNLPFLLTTPDSDPRFDYSASGSHCDHKRPVTSKPLEYL